jgi:hypothetical protein
MLDSADPAAEDRGVDLVEVALARIHAAASAPLARRRGAPCCRSPALSWSRPRSVGTWCASSAGRGRRRLDRRRLPPAARCWSRSRSGVRVACAEPVELAVGVQVAVVELVEVSADLVRELGARPASPQSPAAAVVPGRRRARPADRPRPPRRT